MNIYYITIWLTPNSMVWDWRVSRAGPMPFCWPSCSLLFCLELFPLSLLFLYRLVVWGWGLRTGRVSISLSRPCIANLFLIIIIIIYILETPSLSQNSFKHMRQPLPPENFVPSVKSKLSSFSHFQYFIYSNGLS